MKSEAQRMRELIAAHNGAAGGDSAGSPIEIAARDERAAEGSEQITAWCPTCQERAVPMRNGTCGFCESQIVEPARPPTEAPAAQDPPPEPNRAIVEADAPGVEIDRLRLSDELLLPLDAATQSLAILAVKGAGKSNAAAVLAEELFDEGIPWIVIDPKGDWWGIREAVGDSRGLPVLVLGGLHGDLPLSPYSGSAVAHLIVERNLTCVLDISAMDDEDRPTFLEALGLALFELHRTNPSVRHVIVEEANEVVPERAVKAMLPTLRAWTRIVCQGRQRGIGITLVSQRSALVSKNVLTQTGSLIVLRTTSPEDRKVIRGWTDFHSVSKELVDSLPGLANGEAWIVAPSWLGRVDRVHIRRRWTFDSGATPEVISVRRPQMLESVDVEEIGRLLTGDPAPDAAPDAESATEIAPAVPTEPDDPKQAVLDQLAEGPKGRGEIMRLTGLSIYRLRRTLEQLAAEGLARMEGSYGGARWMLADHEDTPPPPAHTSPESGAEVVAGAASRIVEARGIAQEALEQLDGILDGSGLALLRARYMTALLCRIEAGDMDPTLLDRFERAAGLTESGTPA